MDGVFILIGSCKKTLGKMRTKFYQNDYVQPKSSENLILIGKRWELKLRLHHGDVLASKPTPSMTSSFNARFLLRTHFGVKSSPLEERSSSGARLTPLQP